MNQDELEAIVRGAGGGGGRLAANNPQRGPQSPQSKNHEETPC